MQVINSGGQRALGHEALAHTALMLGWRFASLRAKKLVKGQLLRRKKQFRATKLTLPNSVLNCVSRKRRGKKSCRTNRTPHAPPSSATISIVSLLRVLAGHAIRNCRRACLALREEAIARDEFLRAQAHYKTSADDSQLLANLAAFDARLLKDAQDILDHIKLYPGVTLRPHYYNLVTAYQRYYVKGEAFDPVIAELFDLHIHDSLAGFARDATLPSDPRVLVCRWQ